MDYGRITNSGKLTVMFQLGREMAYAMDLDPRYKEPRCWTVYHCVESFWSCCSLHISQFPYPQLTHHLSMNLPKVRQYVSGLFGSFCKRRVLTHTGHSYTHGQLHTASRNGVVQYQSTNHQSLCSIHRSYTHNSKTRLLKQSHDIPANSPSSKVIQGWEPLRQYIKRFKSRRSSNSKP